MSLTQASAAAELLNLTTMTPRTFRSNSVIFSGSPTWHATHRKDATRTRVKATGARAAKPTTQETSLPRERVAQPSAPIRRSLSEAPQKEHGGGRGPMNLGLEFCSEIARELFGGGRVQSQVLRAEHAHEHHDPQPARRQRATPTIHVRRG